MAAGEQDGKREQLQARRGRYAQADVDRVLSTMVSENARLEGEREELRERVAALEAELAEFRDIEQALLDSVVTGQRAAADVLADAEKEKELIVEAARDAAERIAQEARTERARVIEEIERLRRGASELVHSYRAFVPAALRVLDAMESVAPRPQGAPADENPLVQPTEVYFSRTPAEAGGSDERAADR